MRRGLGVGAAVAALLVTTVPIARAASTASCEGSDWPMFGHDPGRSFASPDACITKVSAAALVPKWYVHTGAPVTAQPAVVHGVVYVGDAAGTMHAIDAASGTQRWTSDVAAMLDHDQGDFGRIPDSAAVVTVGQREVVVFGGGDTLFVLDAAHGTLLSHLCLDRVDPTCQGGSGHTSEIESSPVVVPGAGDGADLVVVGQDANEDDPSGPEGVVALVLAPDGSLSPKWQFDPELGVTYDGLAPLDPGRTHHGCGDVWSSPSVDVPRGIVVFGTGNCNHPRPGSTTEVESTFALDLTSGAEVWQAEPHPVGNNLDLDFGATPNVLGGGLVGEGGKDGQYYVYREGGDPLQAWRVQAATPADIGGFIGSTAVGSVHGHEAVFAASAIPVDENNPMGSLANDATHPQQALGVHAIDTVTHQVVWNAPVGPSYGAAVYDNGVVFVPDTFTDSLVAIDADTGVPLRVQPLDAPPASPVAVSGASVYVGSGTEVGSLGGVWAFDAP